jgi:biopolymer transport protein ExbD
MSRFKSQEVEENVACNLIPMIDIMFLLLLFFMLSADMTQRVTEDIKMPVADMVQPDAKEKETWGHTVINLVGEGEDWHAVIRSQHFQDWNVLKEKLGEIARGEPDPQNTGDQKFSNHAVMLRADANAPYKSVQRLIQMCALVGFYKIEIVASKDDDKTPNKH